MCEIPRLDYVSINLNCWCWHWFFNRRQKWRTVATQPHALIHFDDFLPCYFWLVHFHDEGPTFLNFNQFIFILYFFANSLNNKQYNREKTLFYRPIWFSWFLQTFNLKNGAFRFWNYLHLADNCKMLHSHILLHWWRLETDCWAWPNTRSFIMERITGGNKNRQL
jgi:hypothetical protein